jgi:hypothetical protein
MSPENIFLARPPLPVLSNSAANFILEIWPFTLLVSSRRKTKLLSGASTATDGSRFDSFLSLVTNGGPVSTVN